MKYFEVDDDGFPQRQGIGILHYWWLIYLVRDTTCVVVERLISLLSAFFQDANRLHSGPDWMEDTLRCAFNGPECSEGTGVATEKVFDGMKCVDAWTKVFGHRLVLSKADVDRRQKTSKSRAPERARHYAKHREAVKAASKGRYDERKKASDLQRGSNTPGTRKGTGRWSKRQKGTEGWIPMDDGGDDGSDEESKEDSGDPVPPPRRTKRKRTQRKQTTLKATRKP
jgi:hypothetical protein